MGNVKGLSLRYIGQSMFTSYFFSKTPFLHLFCVPQITKNLLSALQLAKDNISFFEFHPSSRFIKDQVTKNNFVGKKT